MVSLTHDGAQSHYFVPLDRVEGGAITDLLAQGCKLYYQRGKKRIYADPQVLSAHVIPGNRALSAPCPCDSIGIDVGSLPKGVGIIDLDNPSFAAPIRESIDDEAELSIEKTPSGGLHIWGRGIPEETPKNSICVAGLRLEYFTRGRITIIGPGRSITQWAPIGCIAPFPSQLLPARGDITPEIKELIPFGRRWNSLYEQVRDNKCLDREALLFQARYLCKPPLEADKEEDPKMNCILISRSKLENPNYFICFFF